MSYTRRLKYRLPTASPISPDVHPETSTPMPSASANRPLPLHRLASKTAEQNLHTMDGVNIPSETVPDGYKVACEQTLKRARELKKAEPVVAYWCK